MFQICNGKVGEDKYGHFVVPNGNSVIDYVLCPDMLNNFVLEGRAESSHFSFSVNLCCHQNLE